MNVQIEANGQLKYLALWDMNKRNILYVNNNSHKLSLIAKCWIDRILKRIKAIKCNFYSIMTSILLVGMDELTNRITLVDVIYDNLLDDKYRNNPFNTVLKYLHIISNELLKDKTICDRFAENSFEHLVKENNTTSDNILEYKQYEQRMKTVKRVQDKFIIEWKYTCIKYNYFKEGFNDIFAASLLFKLYIYVQHHNELFSIIVLVNVLSALNMTYRMLLQNELSVNDSQFYRKTFYYDSFVITSDDTKCINGSILISIIYKCISYNMIIYNLRIEYICSFSIHCLSFEYEDILIFSVCSIKCHCVYIYINHKRIVYRKLLQSDFMNRSNIFNNTAV